MTSKYVTICIQVFSFKGQVSSVRKSAQVPITSSFLLTWLCLVSSLLNQSVVIYHWLHPMRSPYCSSAQESALYTTGCFYLTCILMALPFPWLGLCSPSHQTWAYFDLNLRGNKVLQIISMTEALDKVLQMEKWATEHNLCYTPCLKKGK